MKNLKIYFPLLILLTFLNNCKNKYERPDQYSIDLFQNEQRNDNQGISHKEALELSKIVIIVDSLQLLDSYKKKNNSFFVYKIISGKVEKESNDTILFPINIFSTNHLNKTKNERLYLEDLKSYKLMIKDFNIRYQVLEFKINDL